MLDPEKDTDPFKAPKVSFKAPNKAPNKTLNKAPNTFKALNKAPNKALNKEPNKEPENSFFQVNTTISKFVFILLILIVFVMLFHLGLYALQYMYGSTRTPYIINGLIDSDKSIVISSNPNLDNSVPILRSVNELTGIEYTWSIWLYIEDPFLNSGNPYKRVFAKGTYTMYDSLVNYNAAFINNSPGLYYGEQDNKLILVFNTYSNDSDVYETIDIDNIPIEKWISCVITLKDKKVNVYINGVMSKEYILLNVPKQNYYDTSVGDDKGFGGYISSLRYYDYAISEENIQTIMANGPNLNRDTTNKIYDNPPWLSMNWYYN